MPKVQQMVRLKQCRSEVGLTQQQLAEMMHTTQQTIARWESGKAAIPSSALKDLAIILHCQIENILGTSPVKRSLYARSMKSFSKGNRDQVSFYGGLNLTIEGISEVLQFPIDEEQYQFIIQIFGDFPETAKSKWIEIRTMNNWLLFINLKSLISLDTFDDDALAAPRFDHPEVYKALSSRSQLEDQELSDELRKYCQEQIEAFEEQNSDEIWSYYNTAVIYTCQGQREEIPLDEGSIERFYEFSALHHDLHREGCRFIAFEDEDLGGVKFFNLDRVSLMMVPAAAYEMGTEEEEEAGDEDCP
jgi:transcriptional regulator with XRE-family HTH domain